MSRDFEFKQLLRAYRTGIVSEATFEQEMAVLEHGTSSSNGSNGGGGFQAFGKTYKSESAAIISFLDKVRAGEETAGHAIPKWVAVCKTDCIRSGLRMVAEREAYHGRVFEQRVRDLGGEKRAGMTDEGRKYIAYISDPNIPDLEKIQRFAGSLPDPKEAIRPICEFAALIKEDLETKEMLRLFAEDELSTATWINESCAALTKLHKEQQSAMAAP
jgi:hypothetical protein